MRPDHVKCIFLCCPGCVKESITALQEGTWSGEES